MNPEALVNGYRATCLMVAAVELGLIDALQSGPSTAIALADRVGGEPGRLLRLMRGLRVIGVVDRQGDHWMLTDAGRTLNVDLLQIVGAEYLPAWANLAAAVRGGRAAFEEEFGETVWQHRAAHPELRASFDRIMPGPAAWPDGLGFAPHGLVVDVGGGDGSLLASVLARHPAVRGIVFDLPEVAPATQRLLASAGIAGRCEFVAGSFFETVPAGGDIYLLRHILHDWDDARAAEILRRCRAAMKGTSRLVVIEREVPDGWDVPSILRDLHMMAVTGGRERTRAEYEALLSVTGFRVTGHAGGVIGAVPCG